MLDIANLMQRKPDTLPPCRQIDAIFLGITYVWRVPVPPNDPRYLPQNEKRVTITVSSKALRMSFSSNRDDLLQLCNAAFDKPRERNLPSLLRQIPPNHDLGKLQAGVRVFAYLVSMTILHEVMNPPTAPCSPHHKFLVLIPDSELIPSPTRRKISAEQMERMVGTMLWQKTPASH